MLYKYDKCLDDFDIRSFSQLECIIIVYLNAKICYGIMGIPNHTIDI